MTMLCVTWSILAQTSGPAFYRSIDDRIIPSMDIHQVDYSKALAEAMASAKVDPKLFSIGEGLEGAVTISLKNISFGVVVWNILRQVDALIERRDNRYFIFHKDKGPSKARFSLDFSGIEPSVFLKQVFSLAGKPYRIESPKYRYPELTIQRDELSLESTLDWFTNEQGIRYRVEKGTYIIY